MSTLLPSCREVLHETLVSSFLCALHSIGVGIQIEIKLIWYLVKSQVTKVLSEIG